MIQKRILLSRVKNAGFFSLSQVTRSLPRSRAKVYVAGVKEREREREREREIKRTRQSSQKSFPNGQKILKITRKSAKSAKKSQVKKSKKSFFKRVRRQREEEQQKRTRKMVTRSTNKEILKTLS